MIELFAEIPGSHRKHRPELPKSAMWKLSLARHHLPVFPLEPGVLAKDYLLEQVKKGFARRFPEGDAAGLGAGGV